MDIYLVLMQCRCWGNLKMKYRLWLESINFHLLLSSSITICFSSVTGVKTIVCSSFFSGNFYYHPHFTDGETKSAKKLSIFLKFIQLIVMELQFESRQSGSSACVLSHYAMLFAWRSIEISQESDITLASFSFDAEGV